MSRDRLQLALERLDSSQWQLFEDLASAFVASQYPNLQTLASASGDRGRDGVLWQPEDDPSVVLQYSVTADWAGKIRDTADRLAAEFDGVQVLILLSPHVIGPAADAVVESVRKKHGYFVQVRDRSWFLDRLNESATTEAAGERLSNLVVQPLLASAGVVPHQAQALNDEEAAAAVLYLAFQLEDDSMEKGLTKSCFDGLVRAALRGTNPENRLSRSDVHRLVAEVVPSGDPAEVLLQVDSALARLEKRSVRRHDPDDFCLSFAERERLAEKMVAFELVEGELRRALQLKVEAICADLGVRTPDEIELVVDRSRTILEKALLDRGEAFVRALEGGDAGVYTLEEMGLLHDQVTGWVSRQPSRLG